MRTDIDSFWIFALASKCRAFTRENIAWSLLIIGLAWIVITLIYWAYPGGPAWGKYKLKNSTPLITISNPIPGPRGLPLAGSMELMTSLAHHKIAAAADAWKARRLMAFSLGDTRVIVTCNPDVAKEILSSSVFADRPVKESAYSLMFNRAIGFAPYGVYWRTLRKIASTHLFCPKQVKASEGQRVQIASQMVSMFNDREKISGFSVRGVLKRASLNNMMCSVFGREYKLDSFNSEVEELTALVEEGYDLLGTLNWTDHLPWLTGFDPQKIRFRCSNLVPRVNRFVSRILAEHRALTRSETPDFVDEMIFRGTDTVAVLIEWILARIVLHPDVQSKVHDELYKVVGRSRAVAESDVTALVYLQAVVKEVLRLHPPGPLLSWARLAITDTTIDGYHVPKGTTAMVNMWAISRDPEFWEDPLQFLPERFVMDVDFLFSADLRLLVWFRQADMPGKDTGLNHGDLLGCIPFEWVPGDENNVDLSEVLRLSCEMANPLTVKLRPRLHSHEPTVLDVQRTTY
uniref:Uncharacterized protein n=1 Tax=Salix viminalis TaxID=40686 RepID=A0A6N2MX32_SALVM